MSTLTAEYERLRQAREEGVPWRRWGPYLSERQWGTVREDYSATGDAWNYFPHEQARSRAYRWGEDGLAGFCNDTMQLCCALALWNGRDAILKERLFGLTNAEGNHGEDVKEYYFYLDAVPSHAYQKMLYKYPQAPFPYDDLVQANRARTREDFEYELLDTHIFDTDRYFDVFVEYAKETPEEILVQISVINRGPDTAELRVLPHLWFRNTWWQSPDDARPLVQQAIGRRGTKAIVARHPDLGRRYLVCEGAGEVLFTENETNETRLFGQPNPTPYVKDGINDYIVAGREDAVNPAKQGTKAAAHYALTFAPGERQVIRLRLTERTPSRHDLFADFDDILAARRREADEFYASLTTTSDDADITAVMRQGFAGLLWSKQAYIYDLAAWLTRRGPGSARGMPNRGRNHEWFHMSNADIISMPDKWEYPWYAAWDLAFHAIALAFVDPDFALEQLELMLQARYAHPNGQIPAYEWNFSDVNPPVHAWATIFNYRVQRRILGDRALESLRRSFHKLLLNFTWWVNRQDREGRNVFEGGFLGLDNIGVFDRSSALPTGGFLEQADGTAWMTLFAQNMLEMALELALHDRVYEEMAIKFYEHFVWIASSMNRVGEQQDNMWDEEDGFYYDVLRLPDGSATRLKVRSMVGLLPLCAVTVYPEEVGSQLDAFVERVRWFNHRHPELLQSISPPGQPGVNGRRMLSVLGETKLRRVLARMLDPEEFLSDYGVRALSRYHLEHPYVFRVGGEEYRVAYRPGESDSGMFGGNSNWRGPIWMPVNVLLIRALLQLYSYYGDAFTIECPTGSGRKLTLFEISQELSQRLQRIFLRDSRGRRPVYGGTEKFQTDPYWRDHVLFYEYFQGDNGAGIGASHQTGWTGLVAGLIRLRGIMTAETYLQDPGLAFDRVTAPVQGNAALR